MNSSKCGIFIWVISSICSAQSLNNEQISKYIKLSNIKVKESYSLAINNGPKENASQLEGENVTTKKKIHIQQMRLPIYLDSATLYLDSALAINNLRADIWIGKTQIAALYNSCKIQTQAFETLISQFRMHPNEMILGDGSKVQSIDDEIKNELLYAINLRWKKQEDSCNLQLSKLLINTYSDYVPGLNALATIQAIFKNDSSWVNYEKAISLDPKDAIVVNNYLNQLAVAKKCDKARMKYLEFTKSRIEIYQSTDQNLKTCNTK